MSNLREYVNWLPLQATEYIPYIKPNAGIPIDNQRINLSLLCGNERKILKTPVDGDYSLVLQYKSKEGAVVSFSTTEPENLSVLQIQGARSKESYRVSICILWIELFSNQVEKMVTHELSPFTRITMPKLEEISGLYETGTEAAIKRYQYFADILKLRYSQSERRYMKELKTPDIVIPVTNWK
ncbi:MAG: hypothetical protein Q8P53_02120 [Candidatus Shapirobacteria bacterium]|nr:hypothetical protein [Candidatus Shapirobacteria bacterium]